MFFGREGRFRRLGRGRRSVRLRGRMCRRGDGGSLGRYEGGLLRGCRALRGVRGRMVIRGG